MNKLLDRYFPHAMIPVSFAAQLLIFCFFQAPVFLDADSAWHLAAGDLIRELGALPAHDPWSFTAGNQPWYNISWLFDITISLLNQWGGLPLLYILTLTIFSAIISFMVREATVRGAAFPPLLFVWIIVTCIAYLGVLMRPNIVSIIGSVIFYVLLMRSREEWNNRIFLILPLLMVIWVNSHGGFPAGLMMIAVFGLEALYEEKKDRFKKLLLLGLLCIPPLLVNPYGIHLFEAMQRTLDSVIREQINEWRPASLSRNIFYAFFLLLTFPALCAPHRVVPLAEKLLVLLWLFMGLSSVRHTIIMAIISLPALATGLTYMLNECRYRSHWVTVNANYQQDMVSPGARMLMLWLAFYIFIGLATPWPRDMLIGKELARWPEKNYPLEEVAFIREHYPKTRFLNNYDQGGFYLLLTRGNPPIFVDGRAGTAYPEEVLKDFLDFVKWGGSDATARDIVAKYDIGGVILPADIAEIERWKKSELWREVFTGKASIIFVKK